MLDDGLSGRIEKRLPLIVVLRLEPAQSADADGQEKTYTDNISPHGARVFSRHPWQAGEVAKLTSLHEGSICGKVVYCEKLPDERYAIGLHILNHPIPWSIVRRFWST